MDGEQKLLTVAGLGVVVGAALMIVGDAVTHDKLVFDIGVNMAAIGIIIIVVIALVN